MPKYPKTSKIELWKNADQWQDETGAWHAGRPRQIANFWASVRGHDNSLVYDQTGQWGRHVITATIARPKWQTPELADHIKYDGKFWIVRAIGDLSFAWGSDMKLTLELDPDYNTEG